jgi:SAM-dependent methyltransferase
VSDGETGDRTFQDQESFDESYTGVPPWDIGRPQPLFVRFADAGLLVGRVLDAGCGTGEQALMAAERGLDTTGVDSSPRAIAIAKRKAAERALTTRFFVYDALSLGELGEQFGTVLDSGLFHIFDDTDRARYVEALAAVVRPGGSYLMACFSDRQPGDWGPRRVRKEEILDSFAETWDVRSIEPATFETNLDPPEVEAWAAVIARR